MCHSPFSSPARTNCCRMKGRAMDLLDTADNTVRMRKSADIPARLDRLPVMAPHIVWISILAINLALEYYDNALFAYTMPAIADSTGLSLGQLGTVSSAFFVGMVAGALAGGWLSDRFGRRQVLVWSTLLYSLGALATAFAPNFEAMILARFVTGVGVQAATSVLLVYVAEMFPSKTRGRFVSILTMGFVVVAPLVALLALVTIPGGGPDTWRHLFIIGSVGLLIAPLVRLVLPESVRWHISRGQFDRLSRSSKSSRPVRCAADRSAICRWSPAPTPSSSRSARSSGTGGCCASSPSYPWAISVPPWATTCSVTGLCTRSSTASATPKPTHTRSS